MSRHPETKLMSILLVLLYLLGSMLLVTLGAGAYSALRSNTDASDTRRMSLGYVANKLRSCDAEGMIRMETRDGIEMAVLTEENYEDCETLLYYYEGALRELFQLKDAGIEPMYGTVLTELKSFDFGFDGNCFRLMAEYPDGESGCLTVYLRAGGN